MSSSQIAKEESRSVRSSVDKQSLVRRSQTRESMNKLNKLNDSGVASARLAPGGGLPTSNPLSSVNQTTLDDIQISSSHRSHVAPASSQVKKIQSLKQSTEANNQVVLYQGPKDRATFFKELQDALNPDLFTVSHSLFPFCFLLE